MKIQLKKISNAAFLVANAEWLWQFIRHRSRSKRLLVITVFTPVSKHCK
jgi:UDP-N-acetyl-D-mannosaminuronic acid transferase (WecB/TagA/CpsF family)